MFKVRKPVLTGLVLLVGGCAMLQKQQTESLYDAEADRIGVKADDILWIADFNAGIKPNLLGGDMGAWDKDPTDMTQTCEAVFDYDEKVEEQDGYSMKLTYDVESPNPAYNGFWMKLENADLSEYKNLVFYIKGDKTAGFTDRIKLELKNASGETGVALISGVTEKWQRKVVPLITFRGLRDRSRMSEFVVVFDDQTTVPKTGIIYIDNIYATK